jgi:hypothetical protein
MDERCVWYGTAARGVYKPRCGGGQAVMGVPPRPGSNCPYCGRPVTDYNPRSADSASGAISSQEPATK